MYHFNVKNNDFVMSIALVFCSEQSVSFENCFMFTNYVRHLFQASGHKTTHPQC